MQAAVLTRHGQPPRFTEHPDPAVATADTVLIRCTAAPITPLDLLCASGTSYFGPPALPYVPGVQGVGRTTGGDDDRVGDSDETGRRVWFSTSAGMRAGDGSMATLCTAAEGDVVPLDDELGAVSDTEVASLGFSAIAAWQALSVRAGLVTGERVLVLGSNGIVGQVAVQAARLLGAAHVTAACRAPAGSALALDQGADAVVMLDPDDDAPALAQRLTQACPGGFDVVLDPLFGVPAAAAVLAMAQGGRLVQLGSSAGPQATFDSATVRSRSLSLLGYTNNSLTPRDRATALRTVLRHAAAGRLSVVHEVRPLSEAAQAWADQARGASGGRIVLTC